MKTMQTVSAAAVVAWAMATPAFAAMSTADFVHDASIGNQFEIKSSQMALDKSQDPDVKKFAQQMVDDHTRLSDQMKSTLSEAKINAPATETMDEKHQKLLDKLESASGKDFDKAYISEQKDAHKETVTLFQNYAKHGKDKPLKDLASQALPTLEDHEKMVKDLKAEEKRG